MMKFYKNINNNDGFTLIELLATITILGILATIAITSISSVVNSAHKNYDESLKGTIISSAKSYYNDHRALLPQQVGQQRIIDISYLVNSKYLSPVKDSTGKKSCTGKVKVVRETSNKYTYTIENFSCS